MNFKDIPKIKYATSGNFLLLAGPCVIENEKMPFEIAEKIIEIADKLSIPLIFKASYKKANRSKSDSFTGIGDLKGLEILKQLGTTYNIPVVTDIHTAEEAHMAKDYVDVLQIPAFLSRQTELLIAAGETGKIVNIKKGQFLSADVMKFAVNKVLETGFMHINITQNRAKRNFQK